MGTNFYLMSKSKKLMRENFAVENDYQKSTHIKKCMKMMIQLVQISHRLMMLERNNGILIFSAT